MQTTIAKKTSKGQQAITCSKAFFATKGDGSFLSISNVSSSSSPPVIQTKLSVGKPDDKYEIEADRVADKVVNMPSPEVITRPNSGPLIQKKCASCEEEEEHIQKKPLAETITPLIQKKEAASIDGAVTSSNVTSRINSSKGSGSVMDRSTQSYMESRFGTDFSNVRLHNDNNAKQLSQELNAQAFTVGNDIYFNEGKYNPNSNTGKHLLAHELTHTVQQKKTNNNSFLINLKRHQEGNTPEVHHVLISCSDMKILFETDSGNFSYKLKECNIKEGLYNAKTSIIKKDTKKFNVSTSVKFDFEDQIDKGDVFRFNYVIEKGQLNPAILFKNKKSVTVLATNQKISDLYKPKNNEPEDSEYIGLTTEEIAERCESNTLRVMTFPFRTTRFGGAPIKAWKKGEFIYVKLPIHVMTNKDFRKQTATLPIETFTKGVKLKENEVVRIHTYEPNWYKLNITGSTDGDNESEFCVHGKDMLQFSDASFKATWLNIGITGVEALTMFVPVGKLTSLIFKPMSKGAKSLAIAGMISLKDVAPTALAGIASRSGIVLIEERAVTQAIGIAYSQTVTRPIAIVAENVASKEVIAKINSAGVGVLVADVSGRVIASYGMGEIVNSLAGGTSVQSAEAQAGFALSQIDASRLVLGKEFTHSEIQVFSNVWNQVANPGEAAQLTLSNSRRLFNNHRNRFWRAVRNNPQARTLIEEMGFNFPSSATTAPVRTLPNGGLARITIDHIVMRQNVPGRALDPSNLRFVFGRENSVVLRLISELDPFQRLP